jgi:hypothetical protein
MTKSSVLVVCGAAATVTPVAAVLSPAVLVIGCSVMSVKAVAAGAGGVLTVAAGEFGGVVGFGCSVGVKKSVVDGVREAETMVELKSAVVSAAVERAGCSSVPIESAVVVACVTDTVAAPRADSVLCAAVVAG